MSCCNSRRISIYLSRVAAMTLCAISGTHARASVCACRGLMSRLCGSGADLAQAVATTHAKVQYPAVCNAVETVLVHRQVAAEFLPLLALYHQAGVEMRGCPETRRILPDIAAAEADWDTEYLDLIVSIRVVDSLEDAIAHINLSRFGAHGYDHHRGARSRGTIPGAGRCSHGHPQRLDAVCRWFSVWQGRRGRDQHEQDPRAWSSGTRWPVIYKYRPVGRATVADYVGPQAKPLRIAPWFLLMYS